MEFLFPAITALSLTLLLGWAALKYFPKWGLLDNPKKYGLKRKPIPYPGGIVLYLAFVILSLLFFEPTLKLLGLLFGSGLLVLISFIDDRIGLPPTLRLGIQALVGIIMVLSGIGVEGITNPFGGTLLLNQFKFALVFGDQTVNILALSGLFTLVWIVLIVNTMNWMDGIPGLTSGLTFIGGLTLFFLSISDKVNQPEVAILAIIVAMMALAFWCFDFYPPKMIIGDSGSMFFGLLLAVLAIFSGGKIATAFLILGFPIMDMIYVIVHRLYNKQAPWKGGEWDRERKAVHLHHRLLDFGFSERQVLLCIYALAGIFGISALFLNTQGKFWAMVIVFALSVALGILLRTKKSGIRKAASKKLTN